jgi:hypothetical protein
MSEESDKPETEDTLPPAPAEEPPAPPAAATEAEMSDEALSLMRGLSHKDGPRISPRTLRTALARKAQGGDAA